MPTYDYRCVANGRVVEITHRMNEQVTTWGDLCSRIGIELGETPAETPVTRMATGGNLIKSIGVKSNFTPSCSTGSCCAGGMCGLN